MHWLAYPWLPYAAIGLVLIATLALFVTLKLDQARLMRSLTDRCRILEEELAACRTLMELSKPVDEPGLPAGPQEANALDPVRRHLALAQLREGQPVTEVAETLGLPVPAIDLLLKVQRATFSEAS